MTNNIKSFAKAVGLSRATIYKLIKEKRLKTVKICQRRLVIESPQEFLSREFDLQQSQKEEAANAKG